MRSFVVIIGPNKRGLLNSWPIAGNRAFINRYLFLNYARFEFDATRNNDDIQRTGNAISYYDFLSVNIICIHFVACFHYLKCSPTLDITPKNRTQVFFPLRDVIYWLSYDSMSLVVERVNVKFIFIGF